MFYRVIKYWAVTLLLITALPLRAAEDVELDPYRLDFVLGNVVFVTLHELAHVVIEDFDIPVLGNSEDAADTLAAVTLIRENIKHPEQGNRYVRMLLSVANANLLLWRRGTEKDNPEVLLARHPLSVQRAARINCMVYGSDPELFEPLPDLVGLPDLRADWCEQEYADAEHAWLWVRKNFVQKSTGTASDHEYLYDAAREADHELIRNWLIQNQVLENTVTALGASKVLPDTITVRTLSCGYVGAYWDIEDRELILCYELIQALYRLSSDQDIKELEDKIRKFHRDKPADSTN